MFQTPLLYNSINECQRRDILILLETYKHWLGDSSGQHILDVGSGSGNATMELLLPQLSEDFNSLVGLDISEPMVKYARAHNTESRVYFVHLDIEEENKHKLRNTFKTEVIEHGFDKVFSFYCLQFTSDNRKSLANIFYLLRPGGKALLSFPVHSPFFDIWNSLLSNDKWKMYLKNCNRNVINFSFHRSNNGLEDYKAVLEETGFEVEDYRIIPSGFIISDSTSNLRDIAKAINPFISLIPEDLHSEYIDEIISIILPSKIIRFGSPVLPHDIIVAAVTKPNY